MAVNKECKANHLSFNECELFIVRQMVDKIEQQQKHQMVMSPEIIRILAITEKFIKSKQLVVYGGQAINAILPTYDRFYSPADIPDWDCYDDHALEHAIELCDIFAKKGFTEVEGKAGVHFGTYKVFVNFIPILDLTYVPTELFKYIQKQAIVLDNVHYAPANLLRMSMYLELSRPYGDISRWEKITKRLGLLNKHYPIQLDRRKCKRTHFFRKMEPDELEMFMTAFVIAYDTLVNEGCVFFGGYAFYQYMEYIPHKRTRSLRQGQNTIPDFDVLSEHPDHVAEVLKTNLGKHGVPNATIRSYAAIGEIVPPSIEVIVGQHVIATIYAPLACHSYNTITIDKKPVHIATIDTILSFYLAFLYVDSPRYDPQRILCAAHSLLTIQEQNKLNQRGLLRRFNMTCIGKQQTLADIRAKRSQKYTELQHKRTSKEYKRWFLRYFPRKQNRTMRNARGLIKK